MTIAKGLLLGSVATLTAAAVGHAADLPIKAKPVQYVKICSLYGAGFYYMPGTDLCIKVGGWVRGEALWGGNGSMIWGPFNANMNNRTTSNFVYRARGYLTADVREQSAYGAIRAYLAVGVNSNDTGLYGSPAVPPSTFSANRAFVQWAGMTAGVTESFYDFYNVPVVQYRGGFLPASETGDTGWMVWAYTAELGGGVSATLSAEARRTLQIIDGNCATGTATPACGSVAPGGFPATPAAGGNLVTVIGNIEPGNGAYGGVQMPDLVANLRVDQAWGAAQIMGALHDINPAYYGATPTTGHPDDELGWAVGAGLRLNATSIAQGDFFQSQLNYGQGAIRYLMNTTNSNWGKVNGAAEAYGVLSDCVYGGANAASTATGCQLTTAWGFNASYEHFWRTDLHTSLYGAYYTVTYNASANAQLCTAAGDGIGGMGSAAVAAPGCNNNWSTWGLGSRTQWDMTKNSYVGVDILYQNLRGASTSDGLTHGYSFGGATIVESNASNWMVDVRAHRDFIP
jgi:hypothetical protein